MNATHTAPDCSHSRAICNTAPSAIPDLSLKERVAALGKSHPLFQVLNDQLRILHRIEEDPEDWFIDEVKLGAYHEELSAWEKNHLSLCLEEWLQVLESNAEFARTPLPEIHVRDFGVCGDGITDDRPAIERALRAAAIAGKGTTVRFPPGRFRLSLSNSPNTHLLVQDLEDVILAGAPGMEGPATEFLGTGAAALLRLVNCRNVQLQNLAFDYDPPLYTQGRVVSIGEDGRSFIWKVDEGFLPPNAPLFEGLDELSCLMLAENDLITPISHDRFTIGSSTEVEPGIWRLNIGAKGTLPPHAAPDRALLIYRRYKWSQAMVLTDCSWVDMENVAVWGAPEFAVFIESSTGVSLRSCQITPRPGGKRLGGLNADGLHARSNRYGPFLQDCSIIRVLDDCLNFQSRMVSVASTAGSHSLVLDMPWKEEDRIGYWQPNRKDYQPGDFLLFVDPAKGVLAGWARIEAVAPCQWNGTQRVLVHFDRPVPSLVCRQSLGKTTPVGSSSDFLHLVGHDSIEHFVINASTKSDGFVIRGCSLGNNTVTAGKIKAGNGLIIKNRTFNHGWCVWSMATEYLWQEGFAARRILLEDNYHDNWFGVSIGSQHPFGELHLGPQLNYRLEFRNNTFVGIASKEYAFDINNVVGCLIQNNGVPERSVVTGPSASQVSISGNYPTPVGD